MDGQKRHGCDPPNVKEMDGIDIYGRLWLFLDWRTYEQYRERSEMSNNTATMQESFPMTGGDGSYSYANNSYFQVSILCAWIFLNDSSILDFLFG